MSTVRLDDLPQPEPQLLSVAVLDLYPDYGRDVSEPRLAKLRRHWIPASIGAIEVSHRGSRYIVIDGNHRITIAKEKGDPATILCLVHEHLSIAQEAALYQSLNNVLPQSPMDLFRAELAAGNDTARRIKQQIEEHGFQLALSKNSHGIRSIRALQGVEQSYGLAHLGATLEVFHRAFGGDPRSARSELLAAVAGILKAYQDQLDVDLLVEIISTKGYKLLEGLARTERYNDHVPPIPLHQAYAVVLVDLYNRERHGRAPRLDKWNPNRPLASERELRKRGQHREAVWNLSIDEVEARPD